MSGEVTSMVDLAPSELGETFSRLRLYSPEAQKGMQLSLTRLGQVAPVLAFRAGSRLEVYDGLKRLHAAVELSWAKIRVEIHDLDAVGAKVRLLCCNTGTGLADLEEAWLVRSLYRDDRLNQPQIAILLSRHKSWVCRKLALAEGLSDELTTNVRLGLVSATTAVELARLERCNQDAVAQVVTQRGLTTRQTAHLVQGLLVAPQEQWPELIEQAGKPLRPEAKKGTPRRTPGEQIVADSWAIRRISARLHAHLLERSLESLGETACAVVSRELVELRSTLTALNKTIDARLDTGGGGNATA
jgi:ParB-like chromosome segregation protein Spo0J